MLTYSKAWHYRLDKYILKILKINERLMNKE